MSHASYCKWPIWASEASLTRTRERAAKPRGAQPPSLARSREAHFAYPNRRANLFPRVLSYPSLRSERERETGRRKNLGTRLIGELARRLGGEVTGYPSLGKKKRNRKGKICLSLSALHFPVVRWRENKTPDSPPAPLPRPNLRPNPRPSFVKSRLLKDWY